MNKIGLTESEVNHSRKILDRGLIIKAGVSDFPVMTEQTRLIIYQLYDLFSAVRKKNAINFQHPFARKPKDTVSFTMTQFLSLLPQDLG